MTKSRIVIEVIVLSLIASLALNLYFYLYIQAQHESLVNNMMIRSLGSYGGQIDTSEYFLNQYLETRNRSLIEYEAAWCAYSAQLAADVCREASSEAVYNQLWSTAVTIQGFADNIRGGGTVNDTKLAAATSALDHIWRFFGDFEIVENENPLHHIAEVYGSNATENLIDYCQVAQNNLPRF